MAATACSTSTSTTTRFGVDEAPELIKNTFLTVTRRAATLANYEATNDEWINFAREVCGAGLDSSEDLVEFVGDRAGPDAKPLVRQMWSTAADAATSSFCPIGRA
jgi:hypothetical protein